MRILMFRMVAMACMFFAYQAVWGVTPNGAELVQSQQWTRTRFSAPNKQQAQGDSLRTLPFSFIFAGKSSLRLLRDWQYSEETKTVDTAHSERTQSYTDPKTGLTVRCVATSYHDFPAVDWVLYFTNTGKANTPIIEQILPLDLRIAAADAGNPVLHYANGEENSARSFAPLEKTLLPKSLFTLAPNGGRSSDGTMPFFNITLQGGGMVFAIGWSGQWAATFARDADGTVIAQAGQQLTHFTLHPGETVRTPSMLLLHWQGDDPLRGNNLFRQLLLAHYLPRRDGKLVYAPICASVNVADPDGSYDGPHLRVLPALAKRGFEVFWSDMDPQQWYPMGFPNGTGTWEPDPVKYPHGLQPIGEGVHAVGLQYLLWFEPERVHPGTYIDREHPEWVLKTPEDWSNLFLLGDPQARKWLTDYIDVQISTAHLDWLRWDFNINPLPRWRAHDAPNRQGITEIEHIEGLYAMWDELMARHPGMLIDICASGGRRLDIETLKRGLPLWHSDLQCSGSHPAADQLQNAGLYRWIPFHGCGNFGYEPDYAFRSAMTMGNIVVPLGAHGISTADPETEAAAKRTVAIYHKIRPYTIGDFYPLFAHLDSEAVWFGYQFDRPDLQAGMAVCFRRTQSPYTAAEVKLQGIDPKRRYIISCEDSNKTKTLRGEALAHLQVTIPNSPGSVILYYHAVSKK